MNKKYIYILYQLVDAEIEKIKNEQYEFVDPKYTTERVYSINDGTRTGYYKTMAIENITGIKIPRNGSLITHELSYEETQRANERNQIEANRMNDNRILYEDLINLKQSLKDLLERQ